MLLLLLLFLTAVQALPQGPQCKKITRITMTAQDKISADMGFAFRALAANCPKNRELDRILVPSNTQVDRNAMTITFKAPNVKEEYFLLKNGQLFIGHSCIIKNIPKYKLSLGCSQ